MQLNLVRLNHVLVMLTDGSSDVDRHMYSPSDRVAALGRNYHMPDTKGPTFMPFKGVPDDLYILRGDGTLAGYEVSPDSHLPVSTNYYTLEFGEFY
jgi:hypothetical protein